MIREFLSPVSTEVIESIESQTIGAWINAHTHLHFPDINEYDVAIIGVSEDRNSEKNHGSGADFEILRKEFYSLYPGPWDIRVADLGTIERGETVTDTYFAVQRTVEFLIQNKKRVIVLGGGHDLSLPVYRALRDSLPFVNLCFVDSNLDITFDTEIVTSDNFIGKIIIEPPHKLFNLVNIGYQMSLVPLEKLDMLDKMFFEAFRLGYVQSDIKEVEPMVRESTFVSVDISACRTGDSPASAYSRVNGFFANEMCTISRYSGLSNNLVFGVFEYNTLLDRMDLSAQMISEMMWYYLEGVTYAVEEQPDLDSDDYIRYLIDIEGVELSFVHSLLTDKWWMELKNYDGVYNNSNTPSFIPCSQRDYEWAAEGKLPEKWVKSQKKFS